MRGSRYRGVADDALARLDADFGCRILESEGLLKIGSAMLQSCRGGPAVGWPPRCRVAMIGVQWGQRRNGDDFSGGTVAGPIAKKRRLIIRSLLRLRRSRGLPRRRLPVGKRLQGGRSRGCRGCCPDRIGPLRLAIETPPAMDTPLLRLVVHGATVRAMHTTGEPPGPPPGRRATFFILTAPPTLCYGGA